MLWIAVQFPLLPLEVQPGFLPGTSQAVQEKQHLLIVSPAAHADGIHAGMKVITAQALSDALDIFSRCNEAEQKALHVLARSLLFLTPAVSIACEDTLLLEISGSLKLFRGAEKIFDLLRQHLDGGRHAWRLATGHTPLSAELLLQQSGNNTRCDSQRINPEHLQEETLRQLQHVPVSALTVDRKLARALAAPGFVTLGELLALPRSAQGKRYGRAWLDWLERLLGEKPDPRRPIDIPHRFHAETEFAEPVEQVQGLVFPAQRLLEKLDAFLNLHQLHSKAIRWHFHHGDTQVSRVLIRRASDQETANLWQELTRRHFEHLQLSAPVQKLALDCARPLPRRSAALSLFEQAWQRPSPATLLERLATLPALHTETLHAADCHVPELAQQRLHALQVHPAPRTTASDAHLDPFADTPLWLLDTPLALRQQHQQPLWRGARLELLPGGQWLHSHWWQQSVARYYRIGRHPDGACCWLFQDNQQQWFLHGFF